MTLSALIRKRDTGNLATATLATFATQPREEPATVARVATVAVANGGGTILATQETANAATVAVAKPPALTAEEEAAIRARLAHIGETDTEVIADVIDQCQRDGQALAYFLRRARQIPPPPEPGYTAACGACRHFQRIDHPNLGHCAQGEPEAVAGLWDTDRRWCMKYEVRQFPVPRYCIEFTH